MSIALTFAITHALGLPIKTVDAMTALGNIVMLHGLFGIAHVDGVYWTLEVELLFYFGMFALYRMKWLGQIHIVLALLVGLRLSYFLFARFAGIDLSWTVSRLLILQYIPWFSLGVSIFLFTSPRKPVDRRRSLLLSCFAVLTLGLADSIFVGILACVLSGLVVLAASGRAAILQHSLLIWLGAISYPLYLLHENIGWSIQLRAIAFGLPVDAACFVALASSLLLATAVAQCVEQPAMHRIRQHFRAKANS